MCENQMRSTSRHRAPDATRRTTVEPQEKPRSARVWPVRRHLHAASRRGKGGVSLMEIMVVLTVIGILLSASVPSFVRSMEQAHADMSGANLRAIWNAQRLYWLENHAYATSLSILEATGLLDSTLVSGSPRYSYAITFADADGFTATATRIGSGHWSGQFAISESGQLTGVVAAPGEDNIVPGFQ